MSDYVDRLVALLRAELKWWDEQQKPTPQPKSDEAKLLRKRGLEVFPPFRERIAVYWLDGADKPGRDGMTNLAWSAAFVSWAMRKAEDNRTFPASQGHSGYVRKAARNQPTAPFVAVEPLSVAVRPGDIVVAARFEEDRNYAGDFDEAKTVTDYTSHGDIVIAVAGGKAQVVGGNVTGGKVGEKTIRLDKGGRLVQPDLDGKPPKERKVHPWIALVRCNL